MSFYQMPYVTSVSVQINRIRVSRTACSVHALCSHKLLAALELRDKFSNMSSDLSLIRSCVTAQPDTLAG